MFGCQYKTYKVSKNLIGLGAGQKSFLQKLSKNLFILLINNKLYLRQPNYLISQSPMSNHANLIQY